MFDQQTILDQLLETWRTNNRVSLFLIDQISDAGMQCTLSKRGDRNVTRQFAHLHNNRVWQLEKRAKDLAEGLYIFETQEEPDKIRLKEQLEASGKHIEQFLEECLAGVPKRRCFKKGVIATLGYFIAHESHHRGNILLTLKECGHKPDQKTQYAIWDWDRL